MDKKFNKVKAFAKKHKKALTIIGVSGMVIIGGTICVMMKRKPTQIAITDTKPKLPKKLEVPKELVKYGVDSIDDYEKTVEFFADKYSVPVKDLGKFGEALCDIPKVEPESETWILINIAKEIDNN